MHDGLDALCSFVSHALRAQIANAPLHLWPLAEVAARRRKIEGSNRVTSRQQLLHERTADGAKRTGDEHLQCGDNLRGNKRAERSLALLLDYAGRTTLGSSIRSLPGLEEYRCRSDRQNLDQRCTDTCCRTSRSNPRPRRRNSSDANTGSSPNSATRHCRLARIPMR